jgi:hypothetical protein
MSAIKAGSRRAADELKARISARVEEQLGPASLDKVGVAFVGTIHSLVEPSVTDD